MKKYIPFIALFLSVSTMVFSQEWHTDFGKAREIAASQKKDIILVSQGSDWCAPCIRLEREILATEAFKLQPLRNLLLPFVLIFSLNALEA